MTPDRLQAAVDAAVRHPSLRSVVPSPDRLVDADAPAPTVRVHDLIGDEDGEARMAEIRERMAATFFDLEHGDTWRVELSLLGDEGDGGRRSVIHLAVALSVADLAGILLLCGELAAHIQAQRDGDGAAQTPPRITFADVREAQAGASPNLPTVSGDVLAGRVDAVLEAPDLPTEPTSLDRLGSGMYRLVETVDEATWDRLGALARELGVTRASMILAIYAESLRRWSDRDDFLVTVPGLSVAGTEDHVLDRTQIYAVRCMDDPQRTAAASFAEFAAELRYRIARDLDAVEELRRAVVSGSGHRGLAPYVLTYSADRPLLPEATTDVLGHPMMIRSSTPQVIIDFQAYRFTADRVHLSFDVRAGVLADGVAEQIFAATVEAVDRLAGWSVDEASSRTMADLVTLPAAVLREREALNSTPAAPRGLLHDDVAATAQVSPDRIALVCTARDTDPVAEQYAQLTYGRLDGLAKTLAAELIGRTEPGDLVAVDLPKGPGEVIAVLGILYAGCAYLPVPAGLPRQRREALETEARPAAVITATDLPLSPEVPDGFEPRSVAPEDTAYVIFTSGSTGTPKGVEMSHAAATNTVRDVRQRNDIGPEDTMIPVASMAFDLSVFDVFGMLGAGGRLICVSDVDARDPFVWLRLIAEHRVTVWNSAPMLLEMLLEAAGPDTPQLPLRIAMCSGDRIDTGLYRRLAQLAPQAVLVAMGGATEGGIWSNEFRIDAATKLHPDWTSVPYGFPLAGQSYRVADAHGRDCGARVVGELWIGGASLATGYLHRPELTAERFVHHDGERWYRTGDLGHWDARNVLVIHGRNDGQVKIRGHRIELGDVEAQLRGLPAVTEAIVFPIRDRTALGAAVVLDAGARDVDGESIRDEATLVLHAHMLPSRIDVWDQLPVTGNGKVDRAAIAAHAAGPSGGPGASGAGVPSQTRLVTELFTELLGVPADEHTNFFAAGGESLSAARLGRRLHDAGYDIGVADILAAPAAGELAAMLAARGRLRRPVGADRPRATGHESTDEFPLTPLQRAYALGRDGLRGQVRASTTFAVILKLGRGVDPAAVHRAATILTESWEALRCVRRGDGAQGPAAVDVAFDHIVEPLRSHLPSYQPQQVCSVLVSDRDPGEVGLVLDYLALDARSLVTITTALIEVAGRAPVPAQVEPRIGDFARHARTVAELSTAAHGPDAHRTRNESAQDPLDLVLPVQHIGEDTVRFASRRLLIDDVDGLSAAAERAGITPSALLLHHFGAALGEALDVDRVPVTVPVSYRPHEGSLEVLGNFTRLETVVVDGTAPPQETGAQLWQVFGRDLSHDAALTARPESASAHRVVFTSTLGLDFSAADFAGAEAAATPVWSLTSTPGVLIDCQVADHRDGIEIRWDHPDGQLDDGFLDAATTRFAARLGLTSGPESVSAEFRSDTGTSVPGLEALTAEKMIDAVLTHFAGTPPESARPALESMAGPQADRLRTGSPMTWSAADLADLIAVLEGAVPTTALLEHPTLGPEAILSALPGFRAFIGDLTDEIADRARTLERPVRVLELGTSAGLVVADRLTAIGADHVWRCVEPDRVLAHIAHRRGQSVSADLPPGWTADVVAISASAHRDPRILRRLDQVGISGDGSVWLCEPTLDSRVILLSAAVLNPAVVGQRVDEPLWHWASVLRDAGFTPAKAVEHDGVVVVRARPADAPHPARPDPQRELPAPPPSAPAPVPDDPDVGLTELVGRAWQQALGSPDVPGPDSDFFADGGDSLTGTRIVAQLAEAGVGGARLVNLFNNPRFADFCAALSRTDTAERRSAAPSSEVGRVAAGAVATGRVPLTAVQRAYLAGRDAEQILGGTNAHCYFELTVPNLDGAALSRAVQTVVARHPALRSRVVDAWTGEVVPEHRNSLPEACTDPRAATEAEVTDPAEPGALRVRVSTSGMHGTRPATVGIGMDNLWLDGASMFVVLRELTLAYRGLPLLPAPALGSGEYLRAHPGLVTPQAAPDRLDAVAAGLPPAPRLWTAPLTSVGRPVFDRAEALVPAARWQEIRRWAASRQLSAPNVVLAAYVRSLADWSGDPALAVNVTQFDRDPAVPDAAALAGDFTRLFVVGVPDTFAEFTDLARTVQTAVIDGVADPAYTTTEVAAQLLARNGQPADALFPVVFTCGLGLAADGRDDLFGRLDRVRSQTPQTVLDLQVSESSAGLHLTADFVVDLLRADRVQRCVDDVARYLVDRPSRPLQHPPVPPRPVQSPAAQPDTPGRREDGPTAEDDLTDQIARLWSTALGVPHVDPDTNFFQAGGDSLTATRLMQTLQHQGMDELSLRTLLENPRFVDFVSRVHTDGARMPAGAVEEGIL
ncbi:amino acid adenylation domain-containing protein [Gordonia sp. (in: high G+C Gram-positive bacteria)]|uniref:amino acid adenylation domain-containing protein n=1 Tax=Gordonia sp. (in: high G+C Gram-positive bacteria) TaxID=84139 RepID=UPI003F960A03